MSARRSAFRQQEATKALKAASRAGLTPSGYEIAPDGTIRVMFGSGAIERRNSFDELRGD